MYGERVEQYLTWKRFESHHERRKETNHLLSMENACGTM